MIITKKYALLLLRKGLARKSSKLIESEDLHYQGIDRLDLCRTDHYIISEKDYNKS